MATPLHDSFLQCQTSKYEFHLNVEPFDALHVSHIQNVQNTRLKGLGFFPRLFFIFPRDDACSRDSFRRLYLNFVELNLFPNLTRKGKRNRAEIDCNTL